MTLNVYNRVVLQASHLMKTHVALILPIQLTIPLKTGTTVQLTSHLKTGITAQHLTTTQSPSTNSMWDLNTHSNTVAASDQIPAITITLRCVIRWTQARRCHEYQKFYHRKLEILEATHAPPPPCSDEPTPSDEPSETKTLVMLFKRKNINIVKRSYENRVLPVNIQEHKIIPIPALVMEKQSN